MKEEQTNRTSGTSTSTDSTLKKHKLKFGLRWDLNFRVKDANDKMHDWNKDLIKTTAFSMFLFSVLLIPFFVYMYLILNNSNLHHYYANQIEVNKYVSVPTEAIINGLMWSACGFAIITLLVMVFIKPIVTIKGLNRNTKALVVFNFIFLGVLTLLLGALSQYFYSEFDDFFRFEIATNNAYDKHDVFKILSGIFKTNKEANKDIYTWQSSTQVWWVLFVQAAIVFLIGISLQNSVFGRTRHKSIEHYIEYKNKKNIDYSDTNKFNQWLNKFFKANDKSLSYWSLIIGVVLLIPQIIYTFIITARSGPINSMTNWIHKVPNLINNGSSQETEDIKQFVEQAFDVSSSSFAISALPILFTGVALCVVLFFAAITFRSYNVIPSFYLIEYITLFLTFVILLIVMIFSKIQIYELSQVWDGAYDNASSTNGQHIVDLVVDVLGANSDCTMINIEGIFPLNNANDIDVNLYYAKPVAILGESIIYFTLLISGFGIIGLDVWKTRKIKLDYEKRLSFWRQMKKHESHKKNKGESQDAIKTPNRRSNRKVKK